jgi:hypothetical protein
MRSLFQLFGFLAYFVNLDLCGSLSHRFLTLLKVPEKPVLMRCVFQHNLMKMNLLVCLVNLIVSHCSDFLSDLFNLLFLPLAFDIVEVTYCGRDLLSLPEFGNHVKEKAPSSRPVSIFLIVEFQLIGVSEVRFCMN